MTVTILTGEAAATLRALPADTFQTCVTSPPYFGLRNYGMAEQIGLEETPDAYVDRLVDVFREVRRVLRSDGTLWLNIGDSYSSGARTSQAQPSDNARRAKIEASGGRRAPPISGLKPKDLLGIPWMLAFALRADGWYLRSEIIWNKPNPMPESVRDRPTSAHEKVFLLSRSADYFYDGDAIKEAWADERQRRDGSQKASQPGRGGRTDGLTNPNGIDPSANGGRNARNVWTIASQPFPGAHFATMPRDLAERCIAAGTSAVGQCPACATPWARIIERREADAVDVATGGDPARCDGGARERNPGGGTRLAQRRVGAATFEAACECGEMRPLDPQRVLDPFGGAGTTALVADRMQRHATIIELNPTYAAMAGKRIDGDAPLFGAVA